MTDKPSDRRGDIPRGPLSRTAKLASLPLGAAGRATLGWGQRLLGADRQEVTAAVQRRTAEQLFEVLGTLKGGAMKFGQALSVYEAAIPDEYAAPYREALTKLQNAAPPMPTATVHRVMAEQLGRGWMSHFAEFTDDAAAAASIGQVHKAVWHDGREVAVKIQYPGAADALKADMAQLNRLGPLFGLLMPGRADAPAAGRTAGPGDGGTGLRRRSRQPAGLRQGLRRRPGHPGAQGGGQRTEGHRQRVDGRHRNEPDHRRRHQGRAGRGRPAAHRAALLRAGQGRAAACGPASG